MNKSVWENDNLYFPLRIKLFQIVSYLSDESSAQTTIHDPVVVTHGQEHHVTDGNRISLWGFDDRRFLSDGANGHNGYLWLVNYGGTHDVAKTSHIGQGEGSALNLIRQKLILTGTTGHVVH